MKRRTKCETKNVTREAKNEAEKGGLETKDIGSEMDTKND